MVDLQVYFKILRNYNGSCIRGLAVGTWNALKMDVVDVTREQCPKAEMSRFRYKSSITKKKKEGER